MYCNTCPLSGKSYTKIVPFRQGRTISLHSLISIAVSIGAAGIPGGGVMIIIVLQAVNLPLHDFGVIIAVEWLL